MACFIVFGLVGWGGLAEACCFASYLWFAFCGCLLVFGGWLSDWLAVLFWR